MVIDAMSWTIVALWCGNKWLVVVQPHVVVWSRSMLWRYDKWPCGTQPHRGCTFDSPGLPTIGGYPGEQGGGNATPLGGCTFFLCAIKCIACNYPWRRIIMIYMVTKTKMNGEIARGILKSTTPKGVGFRVGFIKTG